MNIPAGPWASTTLIPAGSQQPASYAWSAWVQNKSGDLVRSIQFISYKPDGKAAISVVRMFTFGGAWNGVGEASVQGDSYTLNLALGEKVTSCTYWTRTSTQIAGPVIARVKLVTDRGQTLDTAPDDDTLGTGISRPVGSGILTGFLLWEASNWGLLSLCLLFLAPTVTSVSVTNVKLQAGYDQTSTGVSLVALERVHYQNVPTWSFSGTKVYTTTNSWTSTSTTAYKVTESVEISGEFLGIGAKSTTGFEWQTQTTKSAEQSVTESTTLTWSGSGTIAANAPGVICEAQVFQGVVDVPYTADVVLTFSDLGQSRFSESGIYHNVSFSDVNVSTITG